MEKIPGDVFSSLEKKEKMHPEQMEDEVFIGMFEDYDEESGEFIEAQEEDDRETFDQLSWETKRRGRSMNGEYPVFVKKEEYNKLNKE